VKNDTTDDECVRLREDNDRLLREVAELKRDRWRELRARVLMPTWSRGGHAPPPPGTTIH
jgi:hypothetical protein